MNVVVTVKQIPDPAEPGALDPNTKTLKRDGKLILDESDSYGVEMALQLADTAGGGEVTLENIEFRGARASDGSGAAVRQEGGKLSDAQIAAHGGEKPP